MKKRASYGKGEWDSYMEYIYSAFAGFIASVMGTPADVLKSRVMNQPVENGR